MRSILARRDDLKPSQVKYLEDTMAVGDYWEERLREAGYSDEGPRGRAFRMTGDVFESDEEATEILKVIRKDSCRLMV